jgi:hypothetical protein
MRCRELLKFGKEKRQHIRSKKIILWLAKSVGNGFAQVLSDTVHLHNFQKISLTRNRYMQPVTQEESSIIIGSKQCG